MLDKRLAEYQQLNQYTKNIAEEEFKDSSSAAEISQQSCSLEQKQEQEQDILLFSDNLSTSENNYLKLNEPNVLMPSSNWKTTHESLASVISFENIVLMNFRNYSTS